MKQYECPKCGRYMTQHLKYNYGQAFTVYSCPCGYSEDTCDGRYDNKTTYIGGTRSGSLRRIAGREKFF